MFDNWQDFITPVRQWFTSERLKQIDAVVMGWEKMASYDDQVTLVHLTAALVSLFSLSEYQALSPVQKNLVLWIVLYHDVEKEAQKGKRDHTHGFRSAAICGQGLVHHGFIQNTDQVALNEWVKLTQTATRYDEARDDFIQNNSKLTHIMCGIDNIFDGRDTPAGLIVCGVLLHMSLNVVDEFPQAAPLTDDQIRTCISPTLFPLLRVMMLADNMAWGLFDRENLPAERQQTYREFNRVKDLIAI